MRGGTHGSAFLLFIYFLFFLQRPPPFGIILADWLHLQLANTNVALQCVADSIHTSADETSARAAGRRNKTPQSNASPQRHERGGAPLVATGLQPSCSSIVRPPRSPKQCAHTCPPVSSC